MRFKRLKNLAAGAALVGALAGCKGDGANLASGLSGSSASVLSAYFVKSFAPFAAEAARRRTTDPRYTVQNNVWSFPSSSTLYNSYPLASTRAEYAHAAGLSGAGQIVSVVDSGFLTSHEVFAGTALHLPPSGILVDDHGTSVASVVAGSSSSMIGIAPGADLALGVYSTPDTLAEATNEARRLGAVAQNNSWGYLVDVNQSNYNLVFGGSGAQYLSALEQYVANGVVVFAAANGTNRTTSTIMEALPVLRPEFESGWLAVVNAVPVFDQNRIRSATLVSSGCLNAARWCLAADGAWVSATMSGDSDYRFATGSSFAAPQVSGALALLAQAFPSLTPHDLRVRLLASADNSFFSHTGQHQIVPGFYHGFNSQFGHGFLDIRAALLPIGPPTITTASGSSLPASQPVLVAGSAVGSAAAQSLSRQAVLVTDVLGGDFSMGAQALVASRAPAPLAETRLAMLGSGALGYASDATAPNSVDAFSAMALNRVSFQDPTGEFEVDLVLPSGGEDLGIGVTRTVGDDRGNVSFGVSLLRDASGALGLSPSGGDTGAWGAALDLAATARVSSSASLSVFGQIGVMSGADAPGLVEFGSSSFASVGVDLARRDSFRAGDRLGVSVTMPTAVTSGSAMMTLPVSRGAGGVQYDRVAVDMAPDDREMRLSLSYSAPLGDGWSLVAEGVHAMNRGHVPGVRDTGAVLGLMARF